MNKEEHALYQERIRALVREVLLTWLAKFFRDYLSTKSANERSVLLMAIRNKLQAARSDYAEIAFPEATPEISDLRSAEFQEAFDEISKEMETILNSPGLNA
jgi:acyl-CoA reductase-like NAD-dependent aldehyde dehydrogenase